MIAAKIQIERPASLSDFVASVRCIRTWSFGKLSTVSNRIRKKKPQIVGLGQVEAEVEQLGLVVRAWRCRTLAGRRASRTTKPMANIAPPIMHDDLHEVGPDHRAHAAHRRVDDGAHAHDQDAPHHVDAGDRGDRQRRQEQHDAHAAADLHQHAQRARQHADRRMEAHLQIVEHRHQVQPPQQRHDPDRDEHQPEHGRRACWSCTASSSRTPWRESRCS